MAEFVSSIPPDMPVLAVSGEVDIATVDDLLAEGRACLERDAPAVQVDLGAVTFIDSSGLGALVRLRREAIALGKDISLVQVPASIVRLLEVTGLAEAFEVRTTG